MPVTNNNNNNKVFSSSIQPDPVRGSSNTEHNLCFQYIPWFYQTVWHPSSVAGNTSSAAESLMSESNYVLSICLPSIFCLVWWWCLSLQKKKKMCALDQDWPPPNMQCCSGCANREMIPHEADTLLLKEVATNKCNSLCYLFTCSIPETAMRKCPCQCHQISDI